MRTRVPTLLLNPSQCRKVQLIECISDSTAQCALHHTSNAYQAFHMLEDATAAASYLTVGLHKQA